MISIGITGQSGFVGTHLYERLGMVPGKYKRIPFEDAFFEEEQKLRDFVKRCDVIVHLAALVRSPRKGEVYEVNMRLANQIIDCIEIENKRPALFFASSIQEGDGSEYGTYKKDTRAMFKNWAYEHNSGFGCMVFPNLFGPGARPNSHSFIATFCYKLTHGEEPRVLVDNEVSLKYIDSMLKDMLPFMDRVIENNSIEQLEFEPDYRLKVTEVLTTLRGFAQADKDGVPTVLQTQSDKDLYKTFVSYRDYNL